MADNVESHVAKRQKLTNGHVKHAAARESRIFTPFRVSLLQHR